MERRYFQLPEGYVNIDDTALYFTRSGNWQDALAAPERSRQQGPAHAGRRVIGVVLILLGGSFLLFGRMSRALDNGSMMVALALSAFGAYSLYRALRHDLGPVFRIPFARIIAVDATPEGPLTIRFLNGDGKEDRVALKLPAEALPLIMEGFARSRR